MKKEKKKKSNGLLSTLMTKLNDSTSIRVEYLFVFYSFESNCGQLAKILTTIDVLNEICLGITVN